MRRLCPACQREYKHEPVTASGADQNGARTHVIACSYQCLVLHLCDRGLQFSEPSVPLYE